MFCALVLSLAMTVQVRERAVTSQQFARLIEAAMSDISSLSFEYEGATGGIPPGQTLDERLHNAKPLDGDTTYQGSYTYRLDGATRLDWYEVDYRASKLLDLHQISVLHNGRLGRLSVFPDLPEGQGSYMGGAPGSLNTVCSPERIQYLWYFNSIKDPDFAGYEFLGWEDVDGHRCLNVQFDEVPGVSDRSSERKVIKFWIDLERGANPLKVEFYDGKGVRMRNSDIELAQVEFPGGKHKWFPVRGRMYNFLIPGSAYAKKPVGYETYGVLDGTVRFNGMYSDQVFSLDWKGPFVEDLSLSKRRREFKKPLRRYDSASREKRLNEALEEADAQAERLDASSTAIPTGGTFPVWQLSLIGLGAALILGGAGWKWKYG